MNKIVLAPSSTYCCALMEKLKIPLDYLAPDIDETPLSQVKGRRKWCSVWPARKRRRWPTDIPAT
ncbi:hypothetical protein [Sodalis sp.]|uniref:hypothetical protein n=1 Tax=Sodalis sp. (in: enterobacteria) TaxID=1898979 RepID=UPI0038739194